MVLKKRREARPRPAEGSVTLAAMRRRVTLVRAGVWCAVATGPIGLVVAAVPAPAPAPVSVSRPAPRAATDPDGLAEMFLSAWLRSDMAGNGAAERAVQVMGPSVGLPKAARGEGAPKPFVAERTAAVRSTTVAAGRWRVMVAAQSAEGETRFYAVPVEADATLSQVRVSDAPAQVAAPALRKAGSERYSTQVRSGSALTKSVEQFLAAYLCGVGEVGPYLAPGTGLGPVDPAPFTTVEVEAVRAQRQGAWDEPADGVKARVQARVTAASAAGEVPLTYELELSARAGRWEVSGLEAGAGAERGAR